MARKHLIRIVLVGWLVGSLCCGDALARGGGGGGRGGGGGGSRGGGGYSGGGGARTSTSAARAPAVSRPATPSAANRPSTPRPGAGAAGTRPATPKAGGTGVATRPSPGTGARPNAGQLQNFLDLPAGGAAGAGAASRPAGGNAAVSNFLSGDRPAAGTREAGAGNVAGNRADRIDNRGDSRSDLRDQRGEGRDFASDNRQGRVQDRGDRQSVRVENRTDLRSNLADNRGTRRTDRQQQLGNRADQVRDNLRNEFDQNHLFDDFWTNNPRAYWRFQQNPLFWSWATFATISAFMPWNWGSSGAYYDYGEGGNVTYSDDSVQANGETYTTEEYAQQAEDLAASVPETPPKDPEWLPLGVFAMTQDAESPALPNMFLQLAVSKEGIIAGTYQNKTTGKVESVEGMVDKKTQRTAWTIAGKNTPIMETGIANLTLNETKALVHFADGSTQEWLLVRIEKPADGDAK